MAKTTDFKLESVTSGIQNWAEDLFSPFLTYFALFCPILPVILNGGSL